MSTFETYDTDVHRRSGFTLSTRKIGNSALGVAAFLGGFVYFEPAPYELFVLPLLIVWFAFGLSLKRGFLPLTFLLLCYILGGFMAATQRADVSGAFIYIATTAFLSLSAIFYAAVIAQNPVERLSIIFKAYIAAAFISASVGILAYFHLLPGSEALLFGGRAQGTFEDPNVFGPFLVLPILFLLRNILVKPFTRNLLTIFIFSVLMFGIFLAFSRAAWGMVVVTSGIMVLVTFASNPSPRLRGRMILLTLGLGLMAIGGILVALSYDAVSDLFSQRARLVQSYDSAQFGRFARYSYGLIWITEAPLGYGFGKFRETFGEDSHNVFLKAFIVHGWLGGVAYLTFIISTLSIGVRHLFLRTPWQVYFQCVYVTIIGHVMVGMVVDTDRWRHIYLLYGLCWGMIAAERMLRKRLQYRELV